VQRYHFSGPSLLDAGRSRRDNLTKIKNLFFTGRRLDDYPVYDP